METMKKGLEIRNGLLYFDDNKVADTPNSGEGFKVVVKGSLRHLQYNGVTIGEGGVNRKGLYTNNIATPRTLMFDGKPISGNSEPSEPSTPELSPEGYWIPPVQADASDIKYITYEQLLNEYDALMSQFPDRITKRRYENDGVAVKTVNGNHEMFSYTFQPPEYNYTIFIGATVHGNERDAPITTLRLLQHIYVRSGQDGYKELAKIKNNVRIIVVPCISPYGYNNKSMNLPYPGADYGINMNRNYDFKHQSAIPAAGVGGMYPFEMAEIQHVRDVVNAIGANNIDFFMDMHDGGNVMEHYWVNYTVDAPNRVYINEFIQYLVEKHNIENPVIPHVKDTGTSGTAQGWASKTMGMVASTCEWIGGYLGYDFSPSQMTQSMELRANILLMSYNNFWKGNRVTEQGGYLHIDYGRSFTRKSLRKEGPSAETRVSDSEIYARWDALRNKYPSRITKSEELGTNSEGNLPIHTYTFGDGVNKVIYIGGVMRYGGTHKIDEYAIYQLIEYLCDDHYVSQSTHLQNLRNNYKIIVLPFIDNSAGNFSDAGRAAGLNNTALSRKRWEIVSGKTQPADGINGSENHGVKIVKLLIDNNTDAKCIVSGGEILSGYSGNTQEYPTEYETQFVIPKNQIWDLTAYQTHLQNNRSENVTVNNTMGFTFADYAYDNHGIKTYFIQLQVALSRWDFVKDDIETSKDDYAYYNYEAGRRIANIANVFLMTEI